MNIGFNNYHAIENYEKLRMKWISENKNREYKYFMAKNTSPSFRTNIFS